ncbi:MAG: hypothetical protein LBS21_05575 [Clostridiales bacterium]|jgi:hypothetical protein|nr:hypothetical protein [Clostridiales bacterium]
MKRIISLLLVLVLLSSCRLPQNGYDAFSENTQNVLYDAASDEHGVDAAVADSVSEAEPVLESGQISQAEPISEAEQISDVEHSVVTGTEPIDEMITYNYDRNAEEIIRKLRGNIFHRSAIMPSSNDEIYYFFPDGNEYFWFCSAMDGQSRLRAEYGVWNVEDGFFHTTALRIVEWVGGDFERAYGGTGSRYELHGFDEISRDVNLELYSNFRWFDFLPQFTDYYERIGWGFSVSGYNYLYYTDGIGVERLKQDYSEYISLLTGGETESGALSP